MIKYECIIYIFVAHAVNYIAIASNFQLYPIASGGGWL